jgi:hypothetical protein
MTSSLLLRISADTMRCGVALALLIAVPHADASAQDERYAPIVLQLPASTRAIGLGGAFTALRDIESIFSNPAFAGSVTGAAASVERFYASSAGSVAATLSAGTVGTAVSAQVLNFSIPQRYAPGSSSTPWPPVSSHVLTDHGPVAAASLAGAFALATAFKGYRWGAAVKYVEEELGVQRDGAPALDLGVGKEGGTFTYGLSVQNIGPAIECTSSKADLPLRATLGAAALGGSFGPFDAGLSMAVSVLKDGFVAPALGTEWAYSPLEGYNFVVRAGVRRPELREQRPFTLGATFSLDRFSLDYAIEDVRTGVGHRIGLRVR